MADTSSMPGAAPSGQPVGPGSKVYLIDGSGYIFRAYHALPPLTRKSDGLPLGAVHGYAQMLFKLLTDMTDQHEPTHLAVIFDHSGESFRNGIYPAYKANRPPPPEDLVPQFSIVREATRAFGVACVELERYEADDLIAAYARQAEAAGAEVVIISSDKDLMQLVSDKISLFDTMKDRRIGAGEVREKFGVGPERVIDVQALAGDSVDNVPGVPGIGIKTAAQLIEEYGDLETLLARAGEIKQQKRRETLIEHAEAARISKRLVTLDAAAPTPEPIEDFAVRLPDPDRLIAFLEEMEFRTITRRVRERLEADGNAPSSPAPAAEIADPSQIPFDRSAYECVQSAERLAAWIEEARRAGVVAVDTETDSLNQAEANLVGVSLATAPGRACYIPLAHVGEGAAAAQGGAFDFGDGAPAPEQIAMTDAIAALRPLLEDPAVLKVGQNIKYDLAVLKRCCAIEVSPIDDTMLLSFAMGAGRSKHNMDDLALEHLGHTTISFKEVCGTGKNQISFAQAPLDKATAYAAEDADVTLRLWRVLKPRLAAERVATLYEVIERPLAPVIAQMELNGIKVDAGRLSELSSRFAQRMAQFEEEAHEQAGHAFNLGSPKQIGEVLFGEMGLPGGKKTKTGAWSTAVDTMERLAAEGHELPRTILKWRQVSKLRSTYTEALREAINPETGRVHTSFSMVGAATGRLASSDPNLQNIPVRTDEGREIREAFIAEKGNVLVSADYSQIELRVLAHVAQIPQLKQAFLDGLDIHAMTASEMFGVPIEGMDPMVRRKAKAINFGIIYGISPWGLANNLDIDQKEAKAYIDTYFERFPGIRAYMDKTKAFARKHGYVETLFGRRIHTPAIQSKNPAERGFGERAAINAPIQGCAADIIKRAMIRVPPALERAGLSARMLLQVHDELIFECPEAEAEPLIALVREVMTGACRPALELDVPLIVDAQAARNWAEAH